MDFLVLLSHFERTMKLGVKSFSPHKVNRYIVCQNFLIVSLLTRQIL